jgi:glycosyltransferase involved in cell wall biosynthesis
VFTGGNSLYEAKKRLHENIHCFPSSIDKAHFRHARNPSGRPQDQDKIPHPRFGFFGVIDERFNSSLLDEVSERRPDWHFVIVGPVVKIDPGILPRKNNIHYLGPKNYADLPRYLGGWDVAIIPFALNDSTKFISPTKTPEYLAGGKPVISPSITDVVDPYGKLGLVRIADTADQFIDAALGILGDDDRTAWLENVDAFLEGMSWDNTAAQMMNLIGHGIGEKTTHSYQKNSSHV